MDGTVVLRGGTVVDGTGAPGRVADVAVEGGRVVAVGPGLTGTRELDASGQVVAPGFIDIHTHYDAQVFWDPDLTPSSFHGVTTVVAGNCGFSIAPCRPDGVELLVRTLQHVEDMSVDTLMAGVPWDEFASFPQYLDAVERRGVSLNYACYVGHTAVRLAVMGPDAYERPASAEELAAMAAAVEEAHRLGAGVAVHAMGEPGTLYAAQAGVASIDHATQLSDETMRLMREKQIPAVPTFAIFEYFAEHAPSPAAAARERALLDYKIREFKRQIATGIPFAVGSDVGPFPHGTQARELELMVRYGMKPLDVLQADLIQGAKLLGWGEEIGQLKPGYLADIIAVPGNPLEDISTVERVSFVMKGGVVVRQ